MAKETYVLRDGKLVPKHMAETKAPQNGAFFMPDIKPFHTQDGVEISSRSSLRAYERKNGVRQIGNDWVTPQHRELLQRMKG